MTENYDLTMERTYPAPPRAVYDAFLGLYGENRPDWIVESRLDLRPGGSWRVVFHPPGLQAFTHDAQVAFDCIALGDIDRAHTHALTAKIAADAAVTALAAALGPAEETQ